MQNFILLKVIQQEKIRIKHLQTQISHSQIIKDISLSFLYMFLPGRMSSENEFRKYDCMKTEEMAEMHHSQKFWCVDWSWWNCAYFWNVLKD